MNKACRHPLGLAAVLLVASSLGCGPEDTLTAYEVTLVPFKDCSQVGVGAVQCAEETTLREVTTSGRWFFDYRGTGMFSLLTDTGRQLPGMVFENNGNMIAEPTCTGQGGRCHFSRSRTDSIDEETGCLRIFERTVVAVAQGDELSGQVRDVVFNDQTCGTSNIRETLIEVRGRVLDEDVHAREELAP